MPLENKYLNIFSILHICGNLLSLPQPIGELRLEGFREGAKEVQVDPGVDVFANLKRRITKRDGGGGDIKCKWQERPFLRVYLYGFIFCMCVIIWLKYYYVQEKINLEENEPVAEAEMLGYRGYLLGLGLIYEYWCLIVVIWYIW